MSEEPAIPFEEQPTAPLAAGSRGEGTLQPVQSAWGSFALVERVGHGGFGEVYRAWDPRLQREVALKLLLPGAVGGEAEYEAILREARALASVRHPNIVPVYGVDRHDGRVGFWTDFVHGKTLSVLLREQGTFGSREAALIGLDVAKALSAVHRAGLLHRDIKAENVMREAGGRILLMDFGLSSIEKREASVAGTPNYMAPELFQSGQASVASDIYALGVLLYHLVAGEYPAILTGLTAREAVAKIEQRKPLVDLRPDLPDSLLRTVSMATELDPAKRFASAGQLAAALSETLGAAPAAEVVASSGVDAPKPRWRLWILSGVAVAVLVVGLVVWPGALPRLFQIGTAPAAPSPGSTPGSNYDRFQKAQDLLLRSYKNANIEEAIEGFQVVLKSDPSFALAEARLGTAYFIQYRNSHDPKLLDLAREATTRALNLDPNLAPPYVTLSRMAAMQGRTALAMQQAQKALSLDPRSAEAYGALADVYTAQGKDSDAVAAYQKAIDLAPDDWRWPVRLGAIEFGSGNLNDAIAQFQRGVDLAPDNAVAYYDLGFANLQSNRMEEARGDFEASLKIEPTSETYNQLGTVFLFDRKYGEAAAMYRRSIDLHPGDYLAWGNLGLAYKWSGEHREQAGQAFQKAIELGELVHGKNREDPQLLVALADYYAELGNSTKSITLIRQALALAPGNTSIDYEAGVTYEALGQRSEAVSLIVRAIANGDRVEEFQRNPDLASLRADPKFTAALKTAKQTKK